MKQAIATAVLLAVSCAPETSPQTVSIAPLPPSTQSAPPTPVETARASKRHGDTVRVDKTVTFDDCEWLIIEARDAGQKLSSNSEYNDEVKETIGRFVMVHYKITNLTSKEQMMLDRAKIRDAKDREFSPVDMESFYIPPHTHNIALDTIFPNMPKEYWTVIEVPADATRLKLAVHGFALIRRTELVELGL